MTTNELSDTFRLDAEYFLPQRVHSAEIIKNLENKIKLNQISDWITQGPNPKFSDDGIVCLNGRNIYFGTASEGDTNYVSPDIFQTYEKFALLPHDVVITLKHATKIGRVWIISSTEPQMFSRNVGLIRRTYLARQ